MAKIPDFPTSSIRARLRGRVSISSHYGRPIAKKWPRKRPGPGTPAQQQARADFKRLADAQKQLTSFDRESAAHIADNSGYTWRDVSSRAMVGRLILFEYLDMEPPRMDDIQTLLNQLGTNSGALITNFGSLWGLISAGTADQFLAIDPITGIPGWYDFPALGITELTGDIAAGPGSGSQAATLSATGVTPGIYTLASIQVDAKGRLLNAASGSVSPGITEITGDLAAGPGSGSQTGTLAASGVTPGTYPFATVTIDAKGRTTSASAGTIPAAITQLTGDVTTPTGGGSQPATLANTTVAAGTYDFASITLDAKGRATHAATGVVLPPAAAANPGIVPGRWYSSHSSSVPAGATMTPNLLYARPIYIPQTTTIQEVGIQVTSGVLGSSGEIGIYSNNNGLPDTLISDCGTIATISPSNRTITGLGLVLQPGWYWLTIGFSAAVAVRSYTTTDSSSGALMGWVAPNSPSPIMAITGAWTFSAGGLPGTFPSPAPIATVAPATMFGS